MVQLQAHAEAELSDILRDIYLGKLYEPRRLLR